MYVLRDAAKNTSAKDKSTFSLVPKRDDQLLSDKSVNLAAGGGAEALKEESGVSGAVDAGKKKVLLLKGKERNFSSFTAAECNISSKEYTWCKCSQAESET